MFLSMILVYLGIALFLYLTFRNKKPIKWSKIFDVISFKSNLNDDIYNIPGPMRLPFLGTTWMKYFNREDKVHEYYEYLNQTYGDIVLESFGNINIVSIFKQQDIEKVLSMKTRYPFRPPVEITCLYRSQRKDRYTSVGLTNSNGPEWNNLRSKMTSRTLENPKVLSQFFPSQIEICNDLIAEIKACRNKNNIVSNVDDILRLFAFESSSSFIVGRRMGSFGSSKSTIGPTAYAIAEASRNIFSVFQKSFYGNQLWKYFPSLSQIYKDYAKSEDLCYDLVESLIADITKEGLEENGTPLMTILMAKGLDEKDKIAGVVDFFISGTDILQTALLILVHFISLRPDCQRRIAVETKDFRDFASLDEIKEAHFTRAVIMESFRLCPSAFALARIAESDIDLSGYHIKAGTFILNHTSIACQKEESFPNAKEFLPERWINEKGEFDQTLHKGSAISLPFGIGKRRCPGEKYSEFMLIFFIAKLVGAFEVEVLGEMEKVFEFIVRSKTPVDIKFRDRVDLLL